MCIGVCVFVCGGLCVCVWWSVCESLCVYGGAGVCVGVCVVVVVVGCFRLSNKAHNIVLLRRAVVRIKHGYLECTWHSTRYVVSSTNRLV